VNNHDANGGLIFIYVVLFITFLILFLDNFTLFDNQLITYVKAKAAAKQ